MPIRESFRLALTNLWGHKLRSFLTLLGVLISVATLVAVVSLIRGMNRVQAFHPHGGGREAWKD